MRKQYKSSLIKNNKITKKKKKIIIITEIDPLPKVLIKAILCSLILDTRYPVS